MPKSQGSYDWKALKLEWIPSKMSINAFAKSKGIESKHFYNSISRDEWHEARDRMYQKAMKRVEDQGARELVKEYGDYEALWGTVKKQSAKLLKKEELTPTDLNNLTNAIERALKSERLIKGQSTENTKNTVDLVEFTRRCRESRGLPVDPPIPVKEIKEVGHEDTET